MKYVAVTVLIGFVMMITAGCAGRPMKAEEKVEIIAHRGASYIAPENTMASVMLGWEKNADVEVDVYLSRDNRIMVMHDSSTKRTGNVDLKIADTTSDELRKVDVGSFKSEAYQGEPIPFLADIIERIPRGKKLYVEIKCGPEILPVLVPMIEKSGKSKQIVIISFGLETAAAAKKQLPRIPVYWLKGTDKDEVTKQYLPHDPSLIDVAVENGLDGLDLHYAGVNQEFMDAVKAAGQKLYVWTVDDPQEAKRLVDLGVAGITTNRPEWLREQLLQ